ncbi:MAG: hypothetical protein IJX97_02620 [Clostridia bacterium]|nr:hypothetical protein [Clostridia bacterium]
MVLRMDIIKLDEGNMKKIYSIFERLVSIFSIILLSIIATIVFTKYNSEIITVIIAYICIVFIVLALLKLISFPYHIVVNNNLVKVYDFPLLATNNYFEKKSNLIHWNSVIDLYEVKKVEIVKLTKEEKIKHLGYNHFSNKYIKVSFRNSSSCKYIYVSVYSKSQIDKIVEILTCRVNSK